MIYCLKTLHKMNNDLPVLPVYERTDTGFKHGENTRENADKNNIHTHVHTVSPPKKNAGTAQPAHLASSLIKLDSVKASSSLVSSQYTSNPVTIIIS